MNFFDLGHGPFILLLLLWIRAGLQMYIGIKFVNFVHGITVCQTLTRSQMASLLACFERFLLLLNNVLVL